jgi:pimeloyl-ACP methyl ester carboxylesterase
MHTTHFLANGEIQTAYHDLADGAEEPFLLIHGFTGSKLDFTNQLSWFSDLSRVIAYDQRGHGESSNHGPYLEERFVRDLIGFLDRLELPVCHLLGHSFGGMIAMRAVLNHPDRFRSLILMDTSPMPLKMYEPSVKTYLDALVAEQGCAVLLDSMRELKPSAAARRGIDFLGEDEHWRRIATKLQQMDPEAFSTIGDYIGSREDLLPSFAEITCPLTIIVGAEDKPFLKPSRAMADAVDNAVLEIIPRAGHSPQYENAPAWRDTVSSHLQRVS